LAFLGETEQPLLRSEFNGVFFSGPSEVYVNGATVHCNIDYGYPYITENRSLVIYEQIKTTTTQYRMFMIAKV
jgi:hypothetical protein